MKLDRNTNPDGRGKYALINLRTNTVQWGYESPGEQFFVIKYKDKFAHAALNAYAEAIFSYVNEMALPLDQANDLLEYAQEVLWESQKAAELGVKLPD